MELIIFLARLLVRYFISEYILILQNDKDNIVSISLEPSFSHQ